MAIDGLSQAPDTDEAERVQARPAIKGLGEIAGARDGGDGVTASPPSPERPSEHDPEKAELTRAVGELASENADLYKKINDLTNALKQEKARFSTWAKEMAGREEAMTRRMEKLESRLTEKTPVTAPGELERAVGSGRTYDGQGAVERPRSRPRDTAIAVGAGVVGGSLAALGDRLGTTAAIDTTGLLGWGVTIAASTVAWIRERRRDKDADRSHG